MSLMTPLNRVLGLGTAKGAAEHWWLQRVTAVALLPLGLWLAYALLALPGLSLATGAGGRGSRRARSRGTAGSETRSAAGAGHVLKRST